MDSPSAGPFMKNSPALPAMSILRTTKDLQMQGEGVGSQDHGWVMQTGLPI
jgi:hypothetical protein